STQKRVNRLVFEGLKDALTPGQHVPDFPAYLNNLAEQAPDVLRDRVLQGVRSRYSRSVPSEMSSASPDATRLLDDVYAYLTCAEYVRPDAPFDPALHREVHVLLNDPPAMHGLLISHLEEMWKTTFTAEWKRVQLSLRWQVEMFTHHLDAEA